MKCNICEKVKGKRSCMRNNIDHICSLCCGESRNWTVCNTECSYFPQETVNSNPIGDVELTRVYDGHTHKFIKDCFLPNINQSLICNVENLIINITDTNKVEIKLHFKLNSTRPIGNEVYLKDKWKINEHGVQPQSKVLFPLFQVYTKETGQSTITNYRYSVDDLNDNDIVISSSHMNTWLPFSKMMIESINVENRPEYPNTKEISGRVGRGNFFIGKNDTFWGEFYLNKSYSFNIKLNYEKLHVLKNSECVNLPFGIFFPFPLVNIHKKQIYIDSELSLHNDSKLNLLLPIDDKIEQLSLAPIEGNENTLAYSKLLSLPLLEVEDSFHFDKYSIMYFDLLLNTNGGISISSSISNLPIASGIYNTMNKLYEGKFSPAKISITNTTDSLRKFKLICTIDDYSHQYIRTVCVEPYEFLSFPISPTLKEDKVSQLYEISEKSITLKVFHQQELMYEESNLIHVLPKETFIWELEDYGNAWKVYLSQMLARWITPHRTEIDSIIADASRRVGQIQGILSNNMNVILNEMKAIYDSISIDMRYVTRSFSFSSDGTSPTQRISLPSTTLKHKSGNCIDLSVLLASCFEACKLQPIIVLVPGHAFIGVQLGNNKIFIESTLMGSHPFEIAVNQGMINYDKYFHKDGNPKLNNAKLVDIWLSREHGILPME